MGAPRARGSARPRGSRLREHARALPGVLLALTAASAAYAQDAYAPFPRLAPERAGMSAAKLGAALDSVRAWVERDRIRGGILLVIRNGSIVFHEAAGWSDMERGVPLRPDHVVSMRSMTKPLLGAAVLMLVEEGGLRLEDRVAEHLPSFDNERSREITVFQLLTHTSGLTGAIYNDQDGTGTPFATLREAVDAVGERGPTLPPGTEYSYSDPGSSTLGALIEEVSGMPAEAFIERRILEPLGMRESRLWLSLEDPLRSRVTATYRRRDDGWERYWDNTKPESVPFFRASGGLWSSALDYARFMTMLMRYGEFEGVRLLDSATIAHALQPHAAYAFPEADRITRDRYYGFHMSVYTDRWRPVEPPFNSSIFEHSGSDGTVAWADPSNDLLILYLTQSRGHDTRLPLIRLVYEALEPSTEPMPQLHHVGLNTVDAERAIEWYLRVWPSARRTEVAGMPAIEGDMFLVFNEVDSPPPGAWDHVTNRSEPQSAFWHIGAFTNTTDMKESLGALGVRHLPLFTGPDDTVGVWRSGVAPYAGTRTAEQLSDVDTVPPRAGGFSYVVAPDGVLFEFTGGPNTRDALAHVHFFHEHPLCAANWYVAHLGMELPPVRGADGTESVRPPHDPCEVAPGAAGWPSLERIGTVRQPNASVRHGNGTMSFYTNPCVQGTCPGDGRLAPTRGQALDHVAFTVEGLDAWYDRLRRAGVRILEEPHAFGETRAFMIEGPDGLAIELVERPSAAVPRGRS